MCSPYILRQITHRKVCVSLTLDVTLRGKKLVEKQLDQIPDNLSTPEVPPGMHSFLCLPLISWTCKVNDMILKHFLIKIESRTFLFCLQAVNYLTSTHNEQCKTSRNLIKRQRQGPSADGKWLTQLIKYPSVRLNMASLSHRLKYEWDPLHISIFPFPLACGTFIAFIMLTPIYSASFVRSIYVSPDITD